MLTWCAKRRVARTCFNWEGVGKSYDVVNRLIHLGKTTPGRKISSWTMVSQEISVLTPGTWIYVIWSLYDGFVYVGQCGAKFSERHAFQRLIEHIPEARDWQLLHRSTRQKNPFFEWVLKHGFHGLQLSLLEQVPHWKAYLREVFCMHRFGRRILLKKYVPDVKLPRWSWLLKVKTFKGRMHKHNKVTATADATDRATHFVHSLRTTLTIDEQLRLMIDSRELCVAGLALEVFACAQRNIQRDTGNKLPRRIVLGTPFLDLPGKRCVPKRIVSTFRVSKHIPALYRNFLCKCVTCVRKSTPSVMTICQSYRPRICTQDFETQIRNDERLCSCAKLLSGFGVPLVNGHVVTRDFHWLPRMSPALDPTFFQQNMKNKLVPSRSTVSRSVSRDVHRALGELNFLNAVSKPHSPHTS